MRLLACLPLLAACTGSPTTDDSAGEVYSFPALEDAVPPSRSSGGPSVSFEDSELFVNCAPLLGGEKDFEHHNLVATYRGHLVMPWSPEFGTGGISLFDMADPCEPVKVGEGSESSMRESHALGFVHLPEGDPYAGDYMVSSGTRGIVTWDLSDETAPASLTYLELPDVVYPDAYARVVLSVFWQYPWLYVAAADNGLYVLDATDPAAPELVGSYTFDTDMRAGGVFVMGSLMLVAGAEQSTAALLDVSDPTSPQLYPGGLFQPLDEEGEAKEAYHANLTGNWALFARKEGGGGPMVMDISDPTRPTYAGALKTEGGNGGYVFYDEGFLFVGDSHWGKVFDATDLSDIVEVGTGYLPGDLDTITPYGNVAVLSVDEDAEDDVASVVMPWAREPDTAAPLVLRTVPGDGAVGVALGSALGIGFNEFIDPASVQPGSLRLFDSEGRAVDGWGSGQEAIASYVPKEALLPGETYTLEVVAGGIVDLNGNAVADTVRVSFTTAS